MIDRQYSVLLILPLKENGLLNIPLLELVVVFEVDETSCFAGSKVGAAVAMTIGASGIVISEGISESTASGISISSDESSSRLKAGVSSTVDATSGADEDVSVVFAASLSSMRRRIRGVRFPLLLSSYTVTVPALIASTIWSVVNSIKLLSISFFVAMMKIITL